MCFIPKTLATRVRRDQFNCSRATVKSGKFTGNSAEDPRFANRSSSRIPRLHCRKVKQEQLEVHGHVKPLNPNDSSHLQFKKKREQIPLYKQAWLTKTIYLSSIWALKLGRKSNIEPFPPPFSFWRVEGELIRSVLPLFKTLPCNL